MEWIPLPIGVENFEDLREHGYYFVICGSMAIILWIRLCS